MIFHFSPTTGRIEKETNQGLVSCTAAEANDAWIKCDVEDCNIAFRRLAVDFDFDVKAALKWYADQE